MRRTATHTTNGTAEQPPDAGRRFEAALFIYTTLLARETAVLTAHRRAALMAEALADAEELCRRRAG